VLPPVEGQSWKVKMRTKLLLADDQFIFYSALSLWLEQTPDFRLVGVVTQASALLAQVEATQPDILLLDWELAGLPTEKAKTKLIGALRARFARLRIIALSSAPGISKQVLAAGVHAFVSKTEAPDHLLDALQQNRAAG
jgi:two-component system, NarL family, response regulator DesR